MSKFVKSTHPPDPNLADKDHLCNSGGHNSHKILHWMK